MTKWLLPFEIPVPINYVNYSSCTITSGCLDLLVYLMTVCKAEVGNFVNNLVAISACSLNSVSWSQHTAFTRWHQNAIDNHKNNMDRRYLMHDKLCVTKATLTEQTADKTRVDISYSPLSPIFLSLVAAPALHGCVDVVVSVYRLYRPMLCRISRNWLQQSIG